MTRIGALLRAHHDAWGVSWRSIANALGMSSKYAYDVASGRRRVRPARARAYAIALGYDAETWVAAALQDELDLRP